MIKTSRIRSALAAGCFGIIAAALLSPQAEAKTRVTIGVGVGPAFHGECDYSFVFDDCRNFWPGSRFHHYHRHSLLDDPFFHRPRRLACADVQYALRNQGFRHVRARDCQGNFYGFTGTRRGVLYKIRVNSLSGHVSRERI